MRKSATLCASFFSVWIALSVTASRASAEEPSAAAAKGAAKRPTIVEADLGSGVVGVGIERLLLPWMSVRATFQLNRPWYTHFVHGKETDVIGFGGELRPFFFPLNTGPGGLYVSPFARVVGIRAQDGLPASASGVGWSTGTTMGYGFLFGEGRWLARFGAGAQYWAFEVTGATGRVAGMRGVYPDVDIILGYAF